MGADDEPTVVRDEQANRFELDDASDRARLHYRQSGDRLTLVHTDVADALEGRGVGSALVRAALKHAEAEGLTVVPVCPFVAGWLDRHPDRAAQLDIAAP